MRWLITADTADLFPNRGADDDVNCDVNGNVKMENVNEALNPLRLGIAACR